MSPLVCRHLLLATLLHCWAPSFGSFLQRCSSPQRLKTAFKSIVCHLNEAFGAETRGKRSTWKYCVLANISLRSTGSHFFGIIIFLGHQGVLLRVCVCGEGGVDMSLTVVRIWRENNSNPLTIPGYQTRLVSLSPCSLSLLSWGLHFRWNVLINYKHLNNHLICQKRERAFSSSSLLGYFCCTLGNATIYTNQ